METLLEIKASDGLNKDPINNNEFATVFGEPLKCPAGSTFDFITSFIDLGLNMNDLIYIPNDMQLGINFYRYEYDTNKVPATAGTDGDIYAKRMMYMTQPGAIIDNPESGTIPHFPPSATQYGYKCASYAGSNLPSFLLKRKSVAQTGPGIIFEEFEPEEQTATITINSGFYTKTKFCQLVNDQFNLIVGSFTNADKPLLNKAAPVHPYEQNVISAYDYQLNPNSQNPLLQAYEYSYVNANVKAKDPFGIPALIATSEDIYINDRTWPYWFFPVYTIPDNSPQLYLEEDYYPYVWFNANQSGFMSGSAKFNLGYDADNDLFFIDYAHTPILDNRQQEVVVFSRALQTYIDFNDTGAVRTESVGYKSNGAFGGILISRLFSYNMDNTGNPIPINTNFWQQNLGFSGFDDEARQNIIDGMQSKTINMYNNCGNGINNVFFAQYIYSIKYPDPALLKTNTTDSLVPMQWLQQSNYTQPAQDKGASIFSTDIPKVFDSIGTRNIFGLASAFRKETAYFLIEVNIDHIKNDQYRDRDSFRQIMACSGRTYGSGASYIQSFNDCVARVINITDDILISKIEVRILNPDKTPVAGLGQDSTIFLKMTQPLVVQRT